MMPLPPEMIDLYLQRRLKDIEALKLALTDNSVETFNRIGHQLLGTARNYGFANLEPMAKQMDQLPAGDLLQVGPRLIEDFSNWLSKAIEEHNLRGSN